MLKRYGYAWITLIFFAVSIGLHWLFGWFAFVDEAREHGLALIAQIDQRHERRGGHAPIHAEPPYAR